MSVGKRTGVTILRPGCRMASLGGAFSVQSGGGAAAAANGLLNNLIAYWPGDEVAGNALDAHTNVLHLTDTNTVTSNPGIVYPLARQYTSANMEYHTRPGDDALLSTGDIDFTIASWCYLDSLAAFNALIGGKYRPAGVGREYMSYYRATGTTFAFIVSNNGAYQAAADAVWGAPVIINTWYLVIGWHDSVANVTGISVDAGVPVTAAWAAGALDGATAFTVGSSAFGVIEFMGGRIGPTMFWKSAAGAGGVLTAAQRTALYNAGAGLTYAAFTV